MKIKHNAIGAFMLTLIMGAHSLLGAAAEGFSSIEIIPKANEIAEATKIMLDKKLFRNPGYETDVKASLNGVLTEANKGNVDGAIKKIDELYSWLRRENLGSIQLYQGLLYHIHDLRKGIKPEMQPVLR